MFTVGDLRNIAIQIEKNGETTYRNAARAVNDPQLAEMLNWLADDERRHAEWFAKISSTQELSVEQREMEQIGSSLLQDIVKGNTFGLAEEDLVQAEDIFSILSAAHTLEQDTVLFYEFLMGFLDAEESRQQLQRIIQEEKEHVAALNRLLSSEQLNSCSS
jgi:rubrerythrin